MVTTTTQRIHYTGKFKAPPAHFYHNRPFKGDMLSNMEVLVHFLTVEVYIGRHFKHYLFKCLKVHHLRMADWGRNLWMLL